MELPGESHEYRSERDRLLARLEIAGATVLLMILRAAERCIPTDGGLPETAAFIRSEGHALVEFADGTARPLDADGQWVTNATAPLDGIVNLSSGLVKVLVVGPP
jgi:hypothetical protein